jgi:hypothetical protein
VFVQIPPEQESTVQALLSLQFIVGLEQTPLEHISVVHELPSLQSEFIVQQFVIGIY